MELAQRVGRMFERVVRYPSLLFSSPLVTSPSNQIAHMSSDPSVGAAIKDTGNLKFLNIVDDDGGRRRRDLTRIRRVCRRFQ